jgi:hypothetical protein
MSTKSKNIKFFAHQLSLADDNIECSERIGDFTFVTINIHNGSGNKKREMIIWPALRKELSVFLIDYFTQEKEKIYTKIKNEL